MKSFAMTATLAAFVLAPVACNKSPEGGNPGTKDSFKISAPVMETTLKQGERRVLEIDLDRGSDFKKTVALVATAPPGITVELPKSVTAAEPEKVSMTVAAAADAAIGDMAPIVVTATPEAGVATKVEIKVAVESAK